MFHSTFEHPHPSEPPVQLSNFDELINDLHQLIKDNPKELPAAVKEEINKRKTEISETEKKLGALAMEVEAVFESSKSTEEEKQAKEDDFNKIEKESVAKMTKLGEEIDKLKKLLMG